ncbi:hypothetical protein IKF32_01125 [Candidatus Saccharibacteria bacterium]|nr:hypothetical protein [Candidatus Saccharibacteria bacterium]
MLKIIVFDSGYGGENFADYLENEIPIADIIRVIDWRNASEIQSSAKEARRCAEKALCSYIGKVDLIIFANYLLTVTSLNYFRHKYPNQPFIGLELECPCSFVKKDALILTTKAITKTVKYHSFVYKLKPHFRLRTLTLESWPNKIDDGELELSEIKDCFYRYVLDGDFKPSKIIIACSQFNDILPEIKKVLGGNIEICNGIREVTTNMYKTLRLRGGACKRPKNP